MTKKYIPLEVAITAMSADNLLAHFDSVEDVIENRFHRAAERILASIPVGDVLEVVRCRECKHLCVHSEALGVYQCAVHGDYPSGEYFCADGERKDGGQDDG